MLRTVFLGVVLLIVWLTLGPDEVAWSEQYSWERVSETVEVVLSEVEVDGGDSPAPAELTQASSSTSTVAFVIDGDTLELVGGERVRLLGVDTPEREECFYGEATAYLRGAVTGQVVRLERDETNRDEYGRLLRHVFLPMSEGERHLNYELVAEGYADTLVIPPDATYREEFAAAREAAERKALGRWGACG